MIKAIQHIDPFDIASCAMVVMPTYKVVFIHPRLFFNGVIEYQNTCLRLNFTDG